VQLLTRAGFVLLAAGALAGCARSGLGYLDADQGGAGAAGRGATGGDGGRGGSGGGSGGTGGVAGKSGVGGGSASGGSAGICCFFGGGTGGTPGGGSAGGGMGGVAGRPVDPELPVPTLRLPENGRATGSVWSERARRPRFVWDTVPGATYEIEVDDSCILNGFRDCDFPSPVWVERDLIEPESSAPIALPVSDTAPVGRRYFWRVRSCTSTACSPWSAVRYVDVGRQKSDFDGDGYADVVLANVGDSAPRHGRVFVGFGPLPSARSLVLEEAPMPEIQDRFGQVAEPLGDLDGDGFADLLVTASGEPMGPNHALVYFGNEDFGGSTGPEILRLDGDPNALSFGSVVIPAGDVDAEGQQDFVGGDRSLWLFRGASRDVNVSEVPFLKTGEYVGHLSAGDVNGDGYSDLLAGNLLVGDGDFRARYGFLPGGDAGFGEATDLLETVSPFTVMSDVNGDGFRDLGFAYSVGNDPIQNRIDVSYGADPPVADVSVSWGGGMVPGPDTGSYGELSAPIAAGDVNGDGLDDALVGLSWHISDLVQVNLYLGGAGSRSLPDAVYGVRRGPVLFISTGIPKAPGDVNGDGFDDVFVTEDFNHTGALFFGGPELDPTPDDEIQLL